MFDPKQWPFWSVLAPFAFGAAVWFVFNYLFLAPSIIGPRLVETYYGEACIAGLSTARAELAAADEAAESEFMANLKTKMKDTRAAAADQTRQLMGAFFGAYGAEGERFMDAYGDQLGGYAGGQIDAATSMAARQEMGAFQAERENAKRDRRRSLKYSTPSSFCDCSIEAGMSNNFDLAIYTSTFRLFRPKSIADMANGRPNEKECGPAPVI